MKVCICKASKEAIQLHPHWALPKFGVIAFMIYMTYRSFAFPEEIGSFKVRGPAVVVGILIVAYWMNGIQKWMGKGHNIFCATYGSALKWLIRFINA